PLPRSDHMPEQAGTTSQRNEANDWNLWKEREFIEAMSIQRLNFLLVFVGLVVAGVTQTNNKCLQLVILLFGIIVGGFLSLIVCRIFNKVYALISSLQELHGGHPVVVHWNDKPEKFKSLRSVWIQGRIIPLLLILGMIIMCVVLVLTPSPN